MSWKKVLLEGDAAVLSDTVPNTIEPDDSASAGVATEASRQDHEHAIVAAIPTGDVAESASAAEGTATSFSRSDHVHNAPATWAPSAHDLDEHGTATLSELNAKVSDATLDDSGSTRTPSAHLLDSHTAPTSAVDFNKQQATNLALDVQASAPGTPVDGQVYFSSADDHPYVYVA